MMKSNPVVILIAIMATAGLFAGLVYAVLVLAQVAQPSATTVQGLTSRRLWAAASIILALAGVFSGSMALRGATRRIRAGSGRLGAIAALMAGLIATANGGLNLAIANGGPGTGNGVVGGAAALVIGLVAIAIGGAALVRLRLANFGPRSDGRVSQSSP